MRIALLLFLLLLPPRPAISASGSPGVVELVSAADPSLVKTKAGNGPSGDGQLSADGKRIVFISQASDLVSNDTARVPTGSFPDIFLKDLTSGQTTLISVTPDGAHGGNEASRTALISEDGRYVVFESDASDLVTNDFNQASDVFVRDLTTGKTSLVSINQSGSGSGGGRSSLMAMSPDSRFVVFESTAPDLVANDTNQVVNYFIRDLSSGTTRLVDSGATSLFHAPASAAVTADGRFVAFTASGANLVPGVTNSNSEVYVRDLETETTIWASTNVAALLGTLTFTDPLGNRFTRTPDSYGPTFNGNGRFLAFKAMHITNSFVFHSFVFRYDLQTSLMTVVASNIIDELGGGYENSPDLEISGNGRFVLYQSATDDHLRSEIYLWDAESGTSCVVSVAKDGVSPGNGWSDQAHMTVDARFLVFSSDASDLISNNFPTNQAGIPRHIYWRDLETGTTRLISGSGSAEGNNSRIATNPQISADGQTIIFQANDSGLVEGDDNSTEDLFLYDLRSSATRLVSERDPAKAIVTANGSSSLGSTSLSSSDGRFVVFVSDASNLVPNDTNRVADVFVRDLGQGTNLLVSAGKNGNDRILANDLSRSPVMSADGRIVAFVSRATNLVPNDLNHADDVFASDLLTGEVKLVSAEASGSGSGNGTSEAPSISADGRFVAFQSLATNLVSGINDQNGTSDVFVRDLITGSNVLVSVAVDGTTSGDAQSFNPVISPGGTMVLFQSFARNLVQSAATIYSRVFLRDVRSGTTTTIDLLRASLSQAAYNFSADGRWVILSAVGSFITASNTTLNEIIMLYDTTAGTNRLICDRCFSPFLTEDGHYLTYIQRGNQRGPSPTKNSVWVYDLRQDARFLASVNISGTGPANGDPKDPVITRDGRFVAFESKATDLVPNDTNGFTDIFLRDVVSGVTLLVSRSKNSNGSASTLSINPRLSLDGRTLFFESFADDLVAGDQNGARDIFSFRIPRADSDADGLPDYWEAEYFGDLSHNGQMDSDRDGQSDLMELKSGSNPADSGSVLKLNGISVSGNNVTISWNSVPGKTYQVQCVTDLRERDWIDLPGTVTASGVSSFQVDVPGADSQRFYRVLLSE